MRHLLIAVLACAFSFSQTSAQDLVGGKNLIKFNLTGAIFKNFEVQYERVTAPKQSFAIALGVSPNVSLPFKSTLMEQFSDNDDARRAIESTKFTKFTITPEYRFYFSKKGAPSGFYVAPFARYANMQFDQLYNFTPSSGKEHNAPIKGKFSGIGGGVLIGAQWMLSKNISLDWFIMGPFIGTMKADINGTDDMSDMSPEDKADLEHDIESVDIPFWKIDATVGNNQIDAKLTGPFVGIRAFGLSLGFRF